MRVRLAFSCAEMSAAIAVVNVVTSPVKNVLVIGGSALVMLLKNSIVCAGPAGPAPTVPGAYHC